MSRGSRLRVCPVAPPGVQGYADQFQAWAQWAVLTILATCLVGSIGMIIWGRVTQHPRGARFGFDGVLICLVGAVLYVVLPPIARQIVGDGCSGISADRGISHVGSIG